MVIWKCFHHKVMLLQEIMLKLLKILSTQLKK